MEGARAEGSGGDEVIRGASKPRPHKLGVGGSAVSSPSGVRGEALAEIDLDVFNPVEAIS